LGETQTPERHGWRSTWRGFAETFGGLHTQLRALAPDKPVYVFETASAATGGNKVVWLAELARVRAIGNDHSFPESASRRQRADPCGPAWRITASDL